jgi:uncharacterized protein YoxC
MKGILFSVIVAGAAAALLIYFKDELNSRSNALDDVEDAAKDAYKTMDRQINKVERKTGDIIDPALG